MARTPRAPKAPPVAEGAPAEPDGLAGAPPPREARHLFGHAEETRRIAESFRTSPPQALLFEGPRGIGKATLAFRLAKALLATPDPATLTDDLAVDDEGRTAAQVAAGTHAALIHLTRPWDEKTKRFKADLTVDAVRRIVPFLGATAAGGGFRVVIVDAVDDMNPNAANALLKSLEEPPRQTVFILIAHIAGRVMPTIRSRCRTIALRPLATDDVAAALNALGADAALADAAGGSVRRALTLAGTGAEGVARTRRLLTARSLADPTTHLLLADHASTRKDDAFAATVDLIFDALSDRVHAGAPTQSPAALEPYATLYLTAAAERRRLEIFNLDQREYVLSLLHRLAAADRAAHAAP